METIMTCLKCGQDIKVVQVGGLDLIAKHSCGSPDVNRIYEDYMRRKEPVVTEPHPVPDKLLSKLLKSNVDFTATMPKEPDDMLEGIDRISTHEAKKVLGTRSRKGAGHLLRKMGFVPDTPYHVGRKYYWVRNVHAQNKLQPDALDGVNRITSDEAKTLLGLPTVQAAGRLLKSLGFARGGRTFDNHVQRYLWVRKDRHLAARETDVVRLQQKRFGVHSSKAFKDKPVPKNTPADINQLFQYFRGKALSQGYTVSFAAVKYLRDCCKNSSVPQHAMSHIFRHAGAIMHSDRGHIGVVEIQKMHKRQQIEWANYNAARARQKRSTAWEEAKASVKLDGETKSLSNTALMYEQKMKEYAGSFNMLDFSATMGARKQDGDSHFNMIEWQALLVGTEMHDAYRAYERVLLPNFRAIMESIGFNVDKVEIDQTTKAITWRWN